jgi:hypothetical protein
MTTDSRTKEKKGKAVRDLPLSHLLNRKVESRSNDHSVSPCSIFYNSGAAPLSAAMISFIASRWASWWDKGSLHGGGRSIKLHARGPGNKVISLTSVPVFCFSASLYLPHQMFGQDGGKTTDVLSGCTRLVEMKINAHRQSYPPGWASQSACQLTTGWLGSWYRLANGHWQKQNISQTASLPDCTPTSHQSQPIWVACCLGGSRWPTFWGLAIIQGLVLELASTWMEMVTTRKNLKNSNPKMRMPFQKKSQKHFHRKKIPKKSAPHRDHGRGDIKRRNVWRRVHLDRNVYNPKEPNATQNEDGHPKKIQKQFHPKKSRKKNPLPTGTTAVATSNDATSDGASTWGKKWLQPEKTQKTMTSKKKSNFFFSYKKIPKKSTPHRDHGRGDIKRRNVWRRVHLGIEMVTTRKNAKYRNPKEDAIQKKSQFLFFIQKNPPKIHSPQGPRPWRHHATQRLTARPPGDRNGYNPKKRKI